MQNKNIDTLNGAVGIKNVVLLILDGWGLSPSWSGNAISFSNPKNFNKLWRSYPHAVLQAFKGIEHEGKVGNSEIGHASIGCGRIVRQDINELNDAIDNGIFYKNKELINVCEHVKKFKSKLHYIGMLSNGGIHSHTKHLAALVKLAKKNKVSKLYIHIITDGVDTQDRKAVEYIYSLQKYLDKEGLGKISTIVGRDYAMDKSGNINKIEKAYLLQTKGIGNKTFNAVEAVKKYYSEGLTDRNIPPTVINGNSKEGLIGDFDGVVFFNFRSDRARSLTRAYKDPSYFKLIMGRKHKLLKDLYFVSLTSYFLDKKVEVKEAFKTQVIKNSLGEILDRNGLSQLHVAESEKFAHVTYFFNGAKQEPFKKEDRVIIPSKTVQSYAQNPKMSAEEIYKVIKKAINKNKYNFIVANIANVDIVAHSGDIMATKKAVKYTDEIIKKVVDANEKGITIITADHGNAEKLVPTGTSIKETMHTINPVPFIVVKKGKEKNLFDFALESSHIQMSDMVDTKNSLADIAPTILELFKIEPPKQMTGHSLLKQIGYN